MSPSEPPLGSLVLTVRVPYAFDVLEYLPEGIVPLDRLLALRLVTEEPLPEKFLLLSITVVPPTLIAIFVSPLGQCRYYLDTWDSNSSTLSESSFTASTRAPIRPLYETDFLSTFRSTMSGKTFSTS